MTDVIFLVLSVAAVVSAIFVVSPRNPIYSALSLMALMLCLAMVFLQLAAPFLAVMQILVYAGTVVVLFVFVIMMLNLDPRELGEEKGVMYKVFSFMLAGILALFLGLAVFKTIGMGQDRPGLAVGFPSVSAAGEDVKSGDQGRRQTRVYAPRRSVAADFGSARSVGRTLFDPYVFPFELVSVLILISVVGAVVLTKKRL